MRERDWSRFRPELTAEELSACCSLLEMREGRPELRVCELEPGVLRERPGVERLGVLSPIKLPMRDLDSRAFELAAPAWPPEATPDCDAVGADGLVVVGTLIVELSDLPDRVPIESPIREVRPELIRLLELVLEPLVELDDDGVLIVIGLPIREVKFELIRPLEFVFPTWGRLALEDGDEMIEVVGDREVTDLEFMLLVLRVDPNVLGRDDTEVLELIILLELVGGCMDREMLLLEGRLTGAEFVRPMDRELVGARLMLGGELTRGAGAGAGRETCRFAAELLLLELELFRSVLSPKTGPQSRIKTEMSARIPILIRRLPGTVRPLFTGLELPGWYSFDNMICLLSANGSTQVFYSNSKRL